MGKFTEAGKVAEKLTAKTSKREKIRKPKVFDLESGNGESTEEIKEGGDESGKVEEDGKCVNIEAKKRDWACDLRAYVLLWRNDRSKWKFQKNLQSWALKQIFDSELIDKQLFHDILPYMASVNGRARVTLLEDCDRHLEGGDNAEPTTASRRAKKLKAAFMKMDEKTKE